MDQIAWGQSFPGLNTNNLFNRSCKLFTGFPVCCAIFTDSLPFRKVSKYNANDKDCTYTRTYIPSIYEKQQFLWAQNFDGIADDSVRRNTITDYLLSTENLNQSFLWTERVSDRMKYPLKYAFSLVYDEIDKMYLSRFNITRNCPMHSAVTWIEWIEQLSIHARHPFSLISTCPGIKSRKKAIENLVHSHTILQTSLYSVDHILIHHSQYGKTVREKRHMGRSLLFDAGTSTFESSLWWFTCMYLQRNISFDQIFGWEKTLLKPDAFWDQVPSALRSRYHFYNAPVSADISHGNSVLRMIREIALKHDYVALKLDIDTPDVEIPIALAILHNTEVRNLVDEFFFELHFQCDVMTSCGWGKRVPPQSHGLTLDRPHVLQFFIDLRKKGIRAHIWP